MEDGILSDDRVLTHIDARVEGDPVFDPASVSDIDIRVDGEVFAQLGGGADPGIGIDSLRLIRFGEE
jgi:hypothetical protein